jgi:tRNA(Ile)-lysidine synthase
MDDVGPVEGDNLVEQGIRIGHGSSRNAARSRRNSKVGEHQHTGRGSVRHRRSERAVLRALRHALGPLSLRGRRVLVAVSGGIDSVVLAHALHETSAVARLEVCLGHVNHGLRGAASDADQAAVEALAATLGAPCQVRHVDPATLRAGRGSRERPTLQEAARALRYAALHEIATAVRAERIATAHNADDQAETVLLRLLRGTGPDGLGGIPERSVDGRVVRPLLRTSRAEIEAHASAHGLQWREDASNASPGYARNRLRQRWLPGLTADFNPQLLRTIADLAEAQRRDAEWIADRVALEEATRFSLEGEWLRIDAKDWGATPEALARRLARRALLRCGAGRDVSRVHLERMLGFLRSARPGRRLELPAGLVLVRDREGFRMGPLRGGSEVVRWGAC